MSMTLKGSIVLDKSQIIPSAFHIHKLAYIITSNVFHIRLGNNIIKIYELGPRINSRIQFINTTKSERLYTCPRPYTRTVYKKCLYSEKRKKTYEIHRYSSSQENLYT